MTDRDDRLLHSEQSPAPLQATMTTTLKDQHYVLNNPGLPISSVTALYPLLIRVHKSKQVSVSHYKNMTSKTDTLKLLNSSYLRIYKWAGRAVKD